MSEVLLVLTLIAAASTAGLLAFFLMRARSAEREAREELSRSLATFSQTLSTQMGSAATVQNAQFETLRGAVEQQLGRIQQDNSAKLEQMRQTVDEKLHATLEKRLSESFKQVSERLELVHKGLGEMQTLAAGVGDLKRVLSNVKTRGVFGETQLAALLEQVMAPEQYERNVATRPGSRERVEFAIKLPGSGDAPVLLPIDAKFPQEDYSGSKRRRKLEICWRRSWRERRWRRGSSRKREASPRSTSSRPTRPISRCSTCRSKGFSPKSSAGPGCSITSRGSGG